jgi:hypothetical protein
MSFSLTSAAMAAPSRSRPRSPAASSSRASRGCAGMPASRVPTAVSLPSASAPSMSSSRSAAATDSSVGGSNHPNARTSGLPHA